MTPACAGLLKLRKSGLKLLKSTFNAKNFTCRLSWSISSHFVQFTLEMRVAARNSEKFTKTPYSILGVQGHSRSSMLTFLRSSSSVLVMINSMSVPICKHFHVRRANNGRITLFKRGAPISPPRSWGPPSPSGTKFCRKILETLSYRMVPEISVSPGLRSAPGCDRHQDRITIANTRYSYASSCS